MSIYTGEGLVPNKGHPVLIIHKTVDNENLLQEV